uniref:uncharacterized protein LOC122591923 n=1 Tax=Erigeron canadensis TaxID=72917 RepID=UPI001CB91870|nr:uncharacterized protein LOC122591923 [Erigeron canadensis]
MKNVLVDAFKDVAAKFGDDKVFKVCRAKMIDIFSLKDFEGKSDDDDDDELASLLVKKGVVSDDAVGDVMQSGDFVDDGIPVLVNQGENEALDGVNLDSDEVHADVQNPKADVHDKVENMSEGDKEVDDHLSDEEEVYEEELFSEWLCFDQDEESEENMSVPPKVVDQEPPSSPTVLQPAFGKRRRRPAPVLQSPYVNAKTPVNSRICHSELCVTMQMFSKLDISRT